jgi:uncharacterized membrane protein
MDPDFWEHWPLPLATSTLGVILIAWAVFLVLLVAGLAVFVRRANGHASSAPADRRLSGRERRSRRDRRTGSDRRSDRGDRRVGLPDLRGHAPERRRGLPDRRTGGDRRSGEDRRGAASLQAG